MLSPCVKLCEVDLHRGICVGCGRTLEQIEEWSLYTDEEREKIMKELNG
jgi:predicted Fe-S protein YdhL (DUF1289 family)